MVKNVRFVSRASVWAFAILFLLGLASVSRLGAQAGTGTMLGTVTDASGGTISGAKVDVKNLGTGAAQSTITDAQGRYNVPELAIGQYQVQVTMSGFETMVHSGINLTVGSQTVIDFSMRVGRTEQSVTVEGQTVQVETTSTALSTLVESTQMRELPLNGRNFEQLLTLSPGVVQQTGGQSFYGTQANYSVAGSRPEGQAFLLDSTDIQGFWAHGTGSGATGTSLGIDAIAEFQTLINTYSAQFGGNGAVVNAATRSGTNSFHGSGYEFFRNSVLDARNYFDAQNVRPPFRRNQFGATFGGPIKKDKAFFFLNYEGVRQLFAQSKTVLTPDANAHAGILPDCVAHPGPSCVSNKLDNVGVAANVASTLALYPTATSEIPNPGTGGPSGTGPFTEVANQIAGENYGIARFDYNFSTNDSIFARYGTDKASIVQPYFSSFVPLWPETDTTYNHFITVEEKHIFSPNVINLARFSFVRTNEAQTVTGSTSALNFFPGTDRENGQVVVTGLNTIGANILDPSLEIQNKFTFGDDIIWSHGAHNFTFGMAIERIQDNTNGPFEVGGQFTFTSLSSFLAGTSSQVIGALPGQADAHGYLRELLFMPYFQDNWKVTQRLTINLGLRWTPTTNPSEVNHPMEALVNPPFGSFQVVPNAFATNPSLKNLDPRAGFAFDPFSDHKTVIRGGFGMFHDVIQARTILPGYWLNPPFTLGVQLNPTYPQPFAGGGAPSAIQQQQGIFYGFDTTPYQMQYNLNVQREIAPGTILTVGYVGSRGENLVAQRDVNPSQNIGTASNPIFARPTLLANAPVGTPAPVVGATLPGTGYNIVATPLLCGCSNLSFLFEKKPTGSSNYNSLQASVNHQFAHGVQFQVAYTYSKSLDNGSLTYGLEGTNAGLANLENPYSDGSIDYGRSTFDRTHNFRASGLYALPFRQNLFVEGWEVSGIVTAVSGSPFSVVDGFNDSGEGGFTGALSGERPNVVAGCSSNPIVGKVSQWYNPACFSPQAIGTLGNLGRNTLVGPKFTNLDMALIKTTPIRKISENFNVQFRAEFFDALNHPNFIISSSFVATALNVFSRNAATGAISPSPTAGVITQTAGDAVIGGAERVIQFGLKVTF